MRTELIITDKRKEAVNKAPWASTIIKVDGGWMAFETADDYRTWKTQK